MTSWMDNCSPWFVTGCLLIVSCSFCGILFVVKQPWFCNFSVDFLILLTITDFTNYMFIFIVNPSTLCLDFNVWVNSLDLTHYFFVHSVIILSTMAHQWPEMY